MEQGVWLGRRLQAACNGRPVHYWPGTKNARRRASTWHRRGRQGATRPPRRAPSLAAPAHELPSSAPRGLLAEVHGLLPGTPRRLVYAAAQQEPQSLQARRVLRALLCRAYGHERGALQRVVGVSCVTHGAGCTPGIATLHYTPNPIVLHQPTMDLGVAGWPATVVWCLSVLAAGKTGSKHCRDRGPGLSIGSPQ